MTDELSLESLAQQQQSQANFLEELAASVRSLSQRQEESLMLARLQSATPMRLGSYPGGADVAPAGTTDPGASNILADGSVTAGTIAAGAVSVGNLSDGAGTNFAPNPSFEVLNGKAVATYGVPIYGWDSDPATGAAGFAGDANIRYSSAVFKYGALCLELKNVAAVSRKEVESVKIPVTTGRRVGVSWWARGNAGNNAAANVSVWIREYDKNGNRLALSTSFLHTVGATTSFAEASYNVSGTEGYVVANAATTHITIRLSMEALGAVGDTVFVDGIEAYYLDDDVVHAGGNVTIDSTGITIRNGALTLQDEFGVTAATASGFQGGWLDFIHSGLYNASFGAGATGVIPVGRSASLPFWTVAKAVGNPTLNRTADATMPSGYRLRVTFSALNDRLDLASDLVPVVGGWHYGVAFVYGASEAVGTGVQIDRRIEFFDASAVFISAVTSGGSIASGVTAATMGADSVSALAPMTARYARVVVRLYEFAAHNAANYLDLGYVALRPAPPVLAKTGLYQVDGMTVGYSAGQGDLQVGDPAGTTMNVDFEGVITRYRGNTPLTYTPTIANDGGATYTLRTGTYYTIGAMVVLNVAVAVNAVGAGGGGLEFAMPVTPVANQVMPVFVTGAAAPFQNGACIGVLNGTGGAMVVRDSNNLGMTRAHYAAGATVIRANGVYLS